MKSFAPQLDLGKSAATNRAQHQQLMAQYFADAPAVSLFDELDYKGVFDAVFVRGAIAQPTVLEPPRIVKRKAHKWLVQVPILLTMITPSGTTSSRINISVTVEENRDQRFGMTFYGSSILMRLIADAR